MYEYNAIVVRVVDGDTVHFDVDQGFHSWLKDLDFRLAFIQAPELKTPEGQAAKEYIKTLLPVGREVIIRSYKNLGKMKMDNYSRWLGEIFIFGGVSEISVNQLMLDTGHAVRYPKNKT